jgi:hypothetical protein
MVKLVQSIDNLKYLSDHDMMALSSSPNVVLNLLVSSKC